MSSRLAVSADTQIAKEIKHIGIPLEVRGHSAKPNNSPALPNKAIEVTRPITKK